MKAAPVLLLALLALLAGSGIAAPAYVTDELVLGVYADQSTQGQRLATLHSGASVETLAVSGESTQVRLSDGRTGWVKTTYLTSHEPATVRSKQLQDELDRIRATPAALAEAALRNEVERLKRELAVRQTATGTPANGAPANGIPGNVESGSGTSETALAAAASGAGNAVPAAGGAPGAGRLWVSIVIICSAVGLGFWLGYAWLARRIRDKFGGIKVY